MKKRLILGFLGLLIVALLVVFALPGWRAKVLARYWVYQIHRTDGEARIEAFKQLASFGNEAVPHLIELLRSAPPWGQGPAAPPDLHPDLVDIRQFATETLIGLGVQEGRAMAQAMAQILKSDLWRQTPPFLVSPPGGGHPLWVGDPGAAYVLAEMLADESPAVRREAALACYHYHLPWWFQEELDPERRGKRIQAILLALAVAAGDTDAEVRLAAFVALERILPWVDARPNQIEPALVAGLADKHVGCRLAAWQCLKDVNRKEAIGSVAILQEAQNHADAEVRTKATELLATFEKR